LKKLLYIPIVHNAADLGSLGTELSHEGEKKYGAEQWQNHQASVNRSWDGIENEIQNQINDFKGIIRIYQDGLPVAGETGMKIVKDTADKGSQNYTIISNLLAKGAMLEVAENKDLLFKEYYLLSDIGKAETPEKQMIAYLTYQELSDEILKDRDNFIAGRINESLNDEELGIAFFGAAHSITEKLNNDIVVTVIDMFKDDISLNLQKK
jgi:hypothetical protein